MANDFLPFSTSGTANVYTNAEYAADTDKDNGNQPGIAKSKLVNKALRQCSIISTVVAQFIADITGTNAVDDGTTATLLSNLKLATKGMIGTNIASAATTSVGADSSGDVIHITGTTTITSLGTSTTGVKKALIFDGILTLTHNATSLILPGGANITTAAGSTGVFVCIDGALGYWKCIGYTDDVVNKTTLKSYLFDLVAYNDDTTSFIANTLASGAIIERGSNANGEYVKFADGTAIANMISTTTVSSTASGSIFYTLLSGLTPPMTFVGTPSLSAGGFVSGVPSSVTAFWGTAYTQISLRILASTSYASTTFIWHIIIKGRWK